MRWRLPPQLLRSETTRQPLAPVAPRLLATTRAAWTCGVGRIALPTLTVARAPTMGPVTPGVAHLHKFVPRSPLAMEAGMLAPTASAAQVSGVVAQIGTAAAAVVAAHRRPVQSTTTAQPLHPVTTGLAVHTLLPPAALAQAATPTCHQTRGVGLHQ